MAVTDGRVSLEALLERLPAPVAYWDRDLRNRAANAACCTSLGRTAAELTGMHLEEVLGAELYARSLPSLRALLAGEPQLFNRDSRLPSGEWRSVQIACTPDVVDGAVAGFFAVGVDVTEHRRSEIAPGISEERYRTLVEQLPRSSVTVVGSDLKLRLVGGAVVRDLGLEADAVVGRRVREAAGGGAFGDSIERLYARALAGESVRAEVVWPATGGSYSVDIAPLRTPSGEIEALAIAEDVTERRAAEAQLRLQSQITEHMAEGTLLVGAADLVIVHANAPAEAMFGYGRGELAGAPVSVLNAPDGETPEQLARAVAEGVEAGAGSWAGEILSARKDGTTFWRRSAVSRFEHPQHGTLLVSVISDVTERRERDAEERALAQIATLVASNPPPAEVFAAVAEQAATLLDAPLGAVTRFDAAHGTGELICLWSADGDGADHGDVSFALDGATAAARVFRSGRVERLQCAELRSPDPAVEFIERTGTSAAIAAPIMVGGSPWGAVVAAFQGRPIPPKAEQRIARFAPLVALAIANADAWSMLARQASTDSLTGIANHGTFRIGLRVELERARRYGRDLSLVLIDLDHFKGVNDRGGHQTGDRVLTEVARRLSTQARSGELVARIGGEEFAWLLPETTDRGARAAAERIRVAIESEPFQGAGTVTASVGRVLQPTLP